MTRAQDARQWWFENEAKYQYEDDVWRVVIKDIPRALDDFAAARCAQVEAENRALMEEGTRFIVTGGPVVMAEKFDAMKARAEAAESEVTKLKEQNRDAESTLCACRFADPEDSDCNCDIHAARRILKAALAPSREGDNGPK